MTDDAAPLGDSARMAQVQLLALNKGIADMAQANNLQMLDGNKTIVDSQLATYVEMLAGLEKRGQQNGHDKVAGFIDQLRSEVDALQETIGAIDRDQRQVMTQSSVIAEARSTFLLQLSYARAKINAIAGAVAANDGYVGDILKNFNDNISLVEFIITNILATDDPAAMNEMLQKVRVLVATVEDFDRSLVDEVPDLLGSPEYVDGMKVFYAAVKNNDGLLQRHINNVATVRQIKAQARGASEQVEASRQQLDELVAYVEAIVKDAGEAVSQAVSGSEMAIVAVLVGALIALVGMAVWMASTIRAALQVIMQALDKMAQGDFRVDIRLKTKDEFGQLATWINGLAQSLKKVMQELQENAAGVARVAAENDGTSRRSREALERQNAEIQGVAAAITEMESAVTEIARNTDASRDKTLEVEGNAQQGRQVMEQSIHTLGQLSQRIESSNTVIKQVDDLSNQINKIVDVITSIADKTNLLALNAAIEAARAGEQGRGFAVVADEVRQLASQTASSTEEIQNMIAQLQRQSREAVQAMASSVSEMASTRGHIEQAHLAMDQIQRNMVQVRDMANMISDAASQQKIAAEEITRNVNVVSEVSHENFTQVETIARSTSELNQMSNALDDLVQRFKV